MTERPTADPMPEPTTTGDVPTKAELLDAISELKLTAIESTWESFKGKRWRAMRAAEQALQAMIAALPIEDGEGDKP